MSEKSTNSTSKTNLMCPCGEFIVGKDENDLVEKAQEHLRTKHPDHEYTRDEILMLAY
jgi:predicted small metal-binding protein